MNMRHASFRLLFSAFSLFLLLVGGVSAFAESELQPEPVSLEATEEALEWANSATVEFPSPDARAAEKLPRRNLDRESAVELFEAVFGPTLASSSSAFEELADAKFLAPNVAVLDAPGRDRMGGPEVDPVLLESSIPLRAKNRGGQLEPVDLVLEQQEGGDLRPSNPLVPISIPAESAKGYRSPNSRLRSVSPTHQQNGVRRERGRARRSTRMSQRTPT